MLIRVCGKVLMTFEAKSETVLRIESCALLPAAPEMTTLKRVGRWSVWSKTSLAFPAGTSADVQGKKRIRFSEAYFHDLVGLVIHQC